LGIDVDTVLEILSKLEENKSLNTANSKKFSIPLQQDTDNTTNNQKKISIPIEQEKDFSIYALIKSGESSTLEFKSSMLSIMQDDPLIKKLEEKAKTMTENQRTALENSIKEKKKIIEEELAFSIIKTIAAFLNSEGGILLIGVQDDGKVCGIEKDYQVFKDKQNFDGWLQHFVNLVEKQIGKEFFEYINVDQILYEGKTIAKIVVKKSARPAFIEKTNAEFYIRGINTSRSLNPREASNYIFDHWKKF
jgi:hypothetical protein